MNDFWPCCLIILRLQIGIKYHPKQATLYSTGLSFFIDSNTIWIYLFYPIFYIHTYVYTTRYLYTTVCWLAGEVKTLFIMSCQWEGYIYINKSCLIISVQWQMIVLTGKPGMNLTESSTEINPGKHRKSN